MDELAPPAKPRRARRKQPQPQPTSSAAARRRPRKARSAEQPNVVAARRPKPPGIVAGGSGSQPGIVAAASLARVAKQLAAAGVSGRTAGQPRRDASALDLVSAPRPVTLALVSGRGHYDRVIAAVREAQTSVWIATANVKELLVEDHRAAPGRRRTMRGGAYVSILSILDDLAARSVDLRLLHAELPSGPFREELANHPRLVRGALALRRCPRVHLKTVIVDGALMYLGSANWTGAGLGAKGSGRRNFELGIVTDDGPLLDEVQGLFEQIWRGGECDGCKLRSSCPGPLSGL